MKQGRKVKWLPSDSGRKHQPKTLQLSFVRGGEGRAVLDWASVWWCVLIGHVN